MAKGNSCVFIPNVNGDASKPSILYRDFLKKVGGDRPFTNLIYAHYIQDGIADAMDAQGYKRDKFGQHKADDVYKFFDVPSLRAESQESNISVGRTFGINDATGKAIDFNRVDAYDKAKHINNTLKGKVAYVQQHGDKFNVILESKDSRTHYRAAELELQEKQWNALVKAFTDAGIDVAQLERDFPADLNPLTINTYLMYLKSLSEVTNVKYLNKKDLNTILHIAQNSPKIQAIMSRGWGSMEETASRMFDVLHGIGNPTVTLRNAVYNAVEEGKKFQLAMVEQLKKDLRDVVTPSFEMTSKEFDIKETLRELDEKYGIDSNIMVLHSKEISKLSEAAAHAVQTLNRQLSRLVSEKKGHTPEADEVRKHINTLLKEIEGKRYYSGLITFVDKAYKDALKIRDSLNNLSTTGTLLEYAARRADLLADAKATQDSYYFIIKALSNLDSILVDESISDNDKKALQDLSDKAIKELGQVEQALQEMRRSTMTDLCTVVFGDKAIEGKAVADIVLMTEADASIMDFLYSVGRQSNPLIGAMGTIIRDAQLTRDQALSALSLKIREADHKLRKAGHNSEFMYELVNDKTYYIQSDIDWHEYNKAKAKHKGALMKQGLKGFALRDAMDAWVEANTEPETTYGTGQRLPKKSLYGKAEDFQAGWDAAQKEYYDTMMQIKAQIDSLLPEYAQQLYRPPQLRSSWLDIIKQGIDGKLPLKEVVKKLLDRMNIIKIREDDTQYGQLNINGEDYLYGEGDFSGNVVRKIPIFYTSRLRDQSDLLFDFSGAVSALAHTAINYDVMNKIKNIVELMADYIKERPVNAKRDGLTQVEMVENKAIHIASVLRDKSKKWTVDSLVEGFVDKHLYGIEMKDTSTGWRILQAIVNYTSLNQLAPNLKGAISNFLVGEHQMLIDAVAGSLRAIGKGDIMYGITDYVGANALMFGSKFQRGTLMDHLSNDVNSLAHLLAERFDPLQEIAQEMGGKRYYDSMFRQMIGGFNPMGMYSAGEAAIHYVNMYAVLLHEKVLDANGRKVSLYSAFKTSNKKDGNRTLEIKENYKMLDGSDITEEYLNKVKDNIRYINQNTHGSMNKEDKGLIHQHMAGRAVMNFRQWMVEHYSRRYRGRHWDASQRRFVEGYFNTVYKVMKSYISDYVGFVKDANAHWDQLDQAQKENVFRALAEVVMLACLVGLSGALGDPDEHKKEFWYRMWIYQVKRLILDERASVPWGIPKEGITLLDSPVASIKTINGILYPVTGLMQGDASKTLQSGRYKGWNKYGRNLLKNAPFYNQIDQLLHMDEENYVFSIFDR